MTDFVVRFLLCNGIIALIIGILLLLKQIGKRVLASRMQFRLWYLLTGILILPFLPVRIFDSISPVSRAAGWLARQTDGSSSGAVVPSRSADWTGADWVQDFAVSVSRRPDTWFSVIFIAVWLAGILWMLLLTFRAWRRMRLLQSSALPLENPAVLRLYRQCAEESGIQNPPILYSTLCIKSPIFTGFIHTSIYIPLSLTCDCPSDELRYMLLHELQHFRHRDTWLNLFLTLFGILYWFNPAVQYARQKMQDDREMACDESVLELLDPKDRLDYGRTLINFAAFGSGLHSFQASGLTGNHSQIYQRVQHIASYRTCSKKERQK